LVEVSGSGGDDDGVGGEAEGEAEEDASAGGVFEGEFAADGEQFDDHVEDRPGRQGEEADGDGFAGEALPDQGAEEGWAAACESECGQDSPRGSGGRDEGTRPDVSGWAPVRCR